MQRDDVSVAHRELAGWRCESPRHVRVAWVQRGGLHLLLLVLRHPLLRAVREVLPRRAAAAAAALALLLLVLALARRRVGEAAFMLLQRNGANEEETTRAESDATRRGRASPNRTKRDGRQTNERRATDDVQASNGMTRKKGRVIRGTAADC